MLDPKSVQENPDLVTQKMASRGLDVDLSDFLSLSQERKMLLQKVEGLRFELNKTSKQIGQMKKEKKDASKLIADMKKVSDKIKTLEEKLKENYGSLRDILLNIPNIPHESVPEGLTPEANEEVRKFGEKPQFSFSPKPHWDIGENLGILDFNRPWYPRFRTGRKDYRGQVCRVFRRGSSDGKSLD